ncbi:carboxymuconolactone decarboxylase family protein [Telmatobacter sp. DSM 110680]|uniref:Carboxymuconolactone decarboxylase family protein n=1 Tax=Telmatobacter sp. DSM 110680 TaxID=3036704 RepID=A0AAU7DE56_9BACT
MSNKPRMSSKEFQSYAGAAHNAIVALSQAVANSTLDAELQQLVKLRASQMNGCAFCTQLHINESRHMGIDAPKLDLLAVWREAGVFSDREKAALTWTEHLTRLSEHHVSDQDYAAVSAHFAPNELAWLSAAVAVINTWNRIAAPFQYDPPIPRHTIQPAHEHAQV